MMIKAKGVLFLLALLTILTGPLSAHAQGQCSWHLTTFSLSHDFSSKESLRRSLESIRSFDQASSFIKKALKAEKLSRPSFKSEVLNLEKTITPYLDRFNVSLLTNFLEVLVRAKVVHLETSTLEAINLSLVKQISETKIKRLPQLLKNFDELMSRPSEDILKQIEVKITTEIDRLNENNLYWVLKSFARLNYKPSPHFLDVWFKQVELKSQSLNEGHLSGILFSFYLMRSWESIERFVDLIPMNNWQQIALQGTKINNSQISLVSMYMDVVLKKQIPSLQLFRQYFSENVIEPNSGSWLEFEVQMYLTSKKLKYIQEYKTQPGFYVDFFISEQNRIIQVDGKQHYIKSVDSQNLVVQELRPQDKNIDEILKSSGYEVERLDIESVKNL